MAEAETTVTPIRKQRAVHPTRFRVAEGARNTWNVIPEIGTPLEAVLESGYWVNNAAKLRPHDRIEVDAEDGSWTATLFVRSTSKLGAVVSLLTEHKFDPMDAKPAFDDYRVVWKGPIHKHAVVRASDEKTILQGSFDSKEAALGWLAVNAKSLAA